jgi:hypothetical protein
MKLLRNFVTCGSQLLEIRKGGSKSSKTPFKRIIKLSGLKLWFIFNRKLLLFKRDIRLVDLESEIIMINTCVSLGTTKILTKEKI